MTKIEKIFVYPAMALVVGIVPSLVYGQRSGQNNPTNRATIVKERETIEYNPMIFGQFIEHFDTQIYGGIFDPGSKFADSDGFRTDVIDAIRELKTPIVRWPGGCFVSSYHWLGGVGPERTPVWDKAWQVEDPNTFGTDEFIKWCRKIGAEPYICTNAGTGTPEEMSDWVEYCNLTVGKFGKMRAANGHPEPYDVKYWSIGNENWGAHELGAKTVEEWGPMVRESAKLMRAVSKDLKLFAAATPNREWTLPLLQAAGRHLDYVSIHGYWSTSTSYMDCIFRTDRPERDIQRTIDILREAGYADRIKIAFDEWNLRFWYHPWLGDFRRGFDHDERRKNDIASTYTMADALFSACFLNACLRNADYVEMANFSPIVNTRGAIFVHPEGILKRTTFHTLWMYANLLEKNVVPVETVSEMLVSGENTTGLFDVVLSSDETRSRFVWAIVNKDPERTVDFELDFAGMGKRAPGTLRGEVLSGSSPDDYNDIGAENRVVPKSTEFRVRDGRIALPPHSLTFITVE